MSGSSAADRSRSFDDAADVYERARPGYPATAIDWLLDSAPRAALDLGAGTGKLTRALVGRVPRIYAVDPGPRLLDQLRVAAPDVDVREGTAENIPLPNGGVDLVVCAQAWHWVDPARAEPEVARVLRPGGRFGLIWNIRDESVPWVGRLAEIVRRSGAEEYVARANGHIPSSLGPFEHRTVHWQRPIDRAGLLDLVSSRSDVITASPPERTALFDRVSRLLDTDPELRGATQWSLPYRTEIFRTRVDWNRARRRRKGS